MSGEGSINGVNPQSGMSTIPEIEPDKKSDPLVKDVKKEIPEPSPSLHEQKHLPDWDIAIVSGIEATYHVLAEQLDKIDHEMREKQSPDSTKINSIVSDNSQEMIHTISHVLDSIPSEADTPTIDEAKKLFKSLFSRLGEIHTDSKKTPGLSFTKRKNALSNLERLKSAITIGLNDIKNLIKQSQTIKSDTTIEEKESAPPLKTEKESFPQNSHIPSEKTIQLEKKTTTDKTQEAIGTATPSNLEIEEKGVTQTTEQQPDQRNIDTPTPNRPTEKETASTNEKIKQAQEKFTQIVIRYSEVEKQLSDNEKDDYQNTLLLATDNWVDEIDSVDTDLSSIKNKLDIFQASVQALEHFLGEIQPDSSNKEEPLKKEYEYKRLIENSLAKTKTQNFKNKKTREIVANLKNKNKEKKEEILEQLQHYTEEQIEKVNHILPLLNCLSQWANRHNQQIDDITSYYNLINELTREKDVYLEPSQLHERLKSLDTLLCKVDNLTNPKKLRTLLFKSLPSDNPPQDHLIHLLLKNQLSDKNWPPSNEDIDHFQELADFIDSYSSSDDNLDSLQSKYHHFIKIVSQSLSTQTHIDDIASQISNPDEASALAMGIDEHTWFKDDQKMLTTQKNNIDKLKEFGFTDIRGESEIDQAKNALDTLKNLGSKENLRDVKQSQKEARLDDVWETIKNSVLNDVTNPLFSNPFINRNQAVNEINEILQDYAEVTMQGEDTKIRPLFKNRKEEETALSHVLQKMANKQQPSSSKFKKTQQILFNTGFIEFERGTPKLIPYSQQDVKQQAKDISTAARTLKIGIKFSHRIKAENDIKYKKYEEEKLLTKKTIKTNKEIEQDIHRLIESEEKKATDTYKKKLEKENKGIKAFLIKKAKAFLIWSGFLDAQEEKSKERTLSEDDEKKILQLKALKKQVDSISREPHPYTKDSLSHISSGITKCYASTLNLLQEGALENSQAHSIASSLLSSLKLTEKSQFISQTNDKTAINSGDPENLTHHITEQKETLKTAHKKLEKKWFKSRQTKKDLSHLLKDIHTLKLTESLLQDHSPLSENTVTKLVAPLKNHIQHTDTKRFFSNLLKTTINETSHNNQALSTSGTEKETIENRLNELAEKPTPIESHLKDFIKHKIYDCSTKGEDGLSTLYHKDQHRGTELAIHSQNGTVIFDSEEKSTKLKDPELKIPDEEISEMIQLEKKQHLIDVCKDYQDDSGETLLRLSDHVSQKLATPLLDLQMEHLQKTLNDNSYLCSPIDRKVKITVIPPSPEELPLQDIKAIVTVSCDSYKLIKDTGNPEETKAYVVSQPFSGSIEVAIDPEFPESIILGDISCEWGQTFISAPEKTPVLQKSNRQEEKDESMVEPLELAARQGKEILQIHKLFKDTDGQYLKQKEELQEAITISEQLLQEHRHQKETDDQTLRPLDVIKLTTTILSKTQGLEKGIIYGDRVLDNQQQLPLECHHVSKLCTLALARDKYIRSAVRATEKNDPALCKELISLFGESTDSSHTQSASVLATNTVTKDISEHQTAIGNMLQAIETSFNSHLIDLKTGSAEGTVKDAIEKAFLSKKRKSQYNHERAQKALSEFKTSFLSTYYDIDDKNMKVSIKKKALTENEKDRLPHHGRLNKTPDSNKMLKNVEMMKQLELLPLQTVDVSSFISSLKKEAQRKTDIQDQFKDYLSQMPATWPDRFTIDEKTLNPFTVMIKESSMSKSLTEATARGQSEFLKQLWGNKLPCNKIDVFKESQPIIVKLQERKYHRQKVVEQLKAMSVKINRKKNSKISNKKEKLTLFTQAIDAISSIEQGEPRFATKINTILAQLSTEYEKTNFILNVGPTPKTLQQLWEDCVVDKRLDSDKYLQLPELELPELETTTAEPSLSDEMDDTTSYSGEDESDLDPVLSETEKKNWQDDSSLSADSHATHNVPTSSESIPSNQPPKWQAVTQDDHDSAYDSGSEAGSETSSLSESDYQLTDIEDNYEADHYSVHPGNTVTTATIMKPRTPADIEEALNAKSGDRPYTGQECTDILFMEVTEPLEILDDKFSQAFDNDVPRKAHFQILTPDNKIFDSKKSRAKVLPSSTAEMDDETASAFLTVCKSKILSACAGLPDETVSIVSNCASQNIINPLFRSLTLELESNLPGCTVAIPDRTWVTKITPHYREGAEPSKITVEATLSSEKLKLNDHGNEFLVDQPVNATVSFTIDPKNPKHPTMGPIQHQIGHAKNCVQVE